MDKYEQSFVLRPFPHLSRENCERAVKITPDGYRVTFKKEKKTRTPLQNKALFGVAYPPIMEAMGLQGDRDKKDLHEYFCGEYFGWKHVTYLNKKKDLPVRTTTSDENGESDYIDTVEMASMYDFVQRQAAEYGINVPDPDPLWFESKGKKV